MKSNKLFHLGQKTENIHDRNDCLVKMSQKHARSNPEGDFQKLTKVS